jgi:uncharacterized membrane protein
MTTHALKLLHLLNGTLLLGTLISSYLVVLYAGRQQSACLFTSLIRSTFIFDIVVLLTLLAQLLTGSLLVHPRHYDFNTPWITAAYILLTVVVSLWILTIFTRINHYRRVAHNNFVSTPKRLHIYYALILIAVILIIHDAVTKYTFLFGFPES